MGAGYHGGFGNTRRAIRLGAEPALVGKGQGELLKKYATRIPEKSGYTDVVIHGTANNVQYLHNGKWVNLDQRRLSTMLKHNPDYKKGPIRLISCNTGSDPKGFAQNLANKMGVDVIAPSSTLWVFPNGKTVIGPNQFKNTGTWVPYHPIKKVGR